MLLVSVRQSYVLTLKNLGNRKRASYFKINQIHLNAQNINCKPADWELIRYLIGK